MLLLACWYHSVHTAEASFLSRTRIILTCEALSCRLSANGSPRVLADEVSITLRDITDRRVLCTSIEIGGKVQWRESRFQMNSLRIPDLVRRVSGVHGEEIGWQSLDVVGRGSDRRDEKATWRNYLSTTEISALRNVCTLSWLVLYTSLLRRLRTKMEASVSEICVILMDVFSFHSLRN